MEKTKLVESTQDSKGEFSFLWNIESFNFKV